MVTMITLEHFISYVLLNPVGLKIELANAVLELWIPRKPIGLLNLY